MENSWIVPWLLRGKHLKTLKASLNMALVKFSVFCFTRSVCIVLQKLIGVEPDKLEDALTSTTNLTRGSVIKRRLREHQAAGAACELRLGYL